MERDGLRGTADPLLRNVTPPPRSQLQKKGSTTQRVRFLRRTSSRKGVRKAIGKLPHKQHCRTLYLTKTYWVRKYATWSFLSSIPFAFISVAFRQLINANVVVVTSLTTFTCLLLGLAYILNLFAHLFAERNRIEKEEAEKERRKMEFIEDMKVVHGEDDEADEDEDEDYVSSASGNSSTSERDGETNNDERTDKEFDNFLLFCFYKDLHADGRPTGDLADVHHVLKAERIRSKADLFSLTDADWMALKLKVGVRRKLRDYVGTENPMVHERERRDLLESTLAAEEKNVVSVITAASFLGGYMLSHVLSFENAEETTSFWWSIARIAAVICAILNMLSVFAMVVNMLFANEIVTVLCQEVADQSGARPINEEFEQAAAASQHVPSSP